MRANYFLYLIILIGLSISMEIGTILVQIKYGSVAITSPPHLNWILFKFCIFLTSYYFILYHFYQRKYWVSLWAGVFYGLSISVYTMMSYLRMAEIIQINGYGNFVIFGNYSIIILENFFAISLMFSKAGKIAWLRTLGICLFILTMLTGLFFYLFINDITIQGFDLEKILQGIGLFKSLVPAFFIIYFYKEYSFTKTRNDSLPTSESTSLLLGFVCLGAIALTIILGIKWVDISYRSVAWSGEQAQIFLPKTFINRDGESLNYRLLEPDGFDSLQKYPLVICLHGSGGEGSDNLRQFAGTWSANYLSKPEIRKKYPAYIFVPQCPVGVTWGGIEDFPSIETLVFDSISSLMEENNIDETRIYIIGFSMGGYGTWNFIGKHPGFFAAAIPIAGAGNPSMTPNLVDLPIWAFHGSEDQLVPVEGARNMINALLDAGGSPRFSEIPEKGHNIVEALEENAPELFDWLFDQKKVFSSTFY